MTSRKEHSKTARVLKSARQKSEFENKKLRQRASSLAGRPIKIGGGRATRGQGSHPKLGRAVSVLLKIHAGGKAGDAYSERGAGAQHIDSNMLGQTARERAGEWRLDELKHPGVNPKNLFCHVSFSRPTGHELTPEQWQLLCLKFIQKIGADGNFTATRHTPPATANDHVHLVFSRSKCDGKLVSLSNNRWAWRAAVREIEKEMGIQLPDQPGERPANTPTSDRAVSAQRRAARAGTPDPHIHPEIISQVLASAATPEAFQARLASVGIEVKPAVANGKTTGILFKKRGAAEWLAGSSISREFSLPKIQAQIELNRQALLKQEQQIQFQRQRQAYEQQRQQIHHSQQARRRPKGG